MIDKTAPDPAPVEVTDPDDPSWVEPAEVAVRVNPHHLLPVFDAPKWPGTEPPPTGTVGTSLPDAPDSLGDALRRDQQLPPALADSFPERNDDPERDPEGHA